MCSAAQICARTYGALGAAGNCSILLTLVVLGAYFNSEPQEEDVQSEDLSYSQIGKRQGLEHQTSHSSLLSAFQEMFVLKRATQYQSQTCGEGRTVFVAILARMVIVPAVMLPVMAILAKFDFRDVFEDAVFVVANVLFDSESASTDARADNASGVE
ncbi:hypothetical protein AZE42_02684 [Rhizopogon vesiculosus]|uniref:Uncharacterized protein n=1 Tax=Rhizopogon vesiculosus TaxID=180088 RepID=A0A1J8R361_9AGAM|nr:hypothetical protein AZE42_02684 [Rhizopogon vesiculosus]